MSSYLDMCDGRLALEVQRWPVQRSTAAGQATEGAPLHLYRSHEPQVGVICDGAHRRNSPLAFNRRNSVALTTYVQHTTNALSQVKHLSRVDLVHPHVRAFMGF